ncbi:MAG: TonB-dependent receptor plug domain-containing protein [Bacteroidales bacterium]|nr:TonB-dependent receptor plug domain-containing protein [Bacteroidales bacterium]
MAWSSWKILLLVSIFLSVVPNSRLLGQEKPFSGTVTDTAGVAIPGVTVYLPVMNKGTVTSADGTFTLSIDNIGNDSVTVSFTCIGYRKLTLTFGPDQTIIPLTIKLLHEVIVMDDIRVTATRQDNITVINIPAVAGAVIPSVAGGVESAIATLPGVSSFSELSSGYSVRGGSYDENLVYINDVEVYRPYLIRTGQQEGLSRINPDLTASVNFSPGGFSAAYGDRMSSVLDITYREPEKREGSVSLSLLTSSAHAGARSNDDRFWFIAGARYRSNAILLGSLDDRGAYRPHFADLQAIGGFQPDNRTRLTLSLWGSSNIYTFVPRSRTTTFGTFENAYRLYAYFEGGERDRYHTGGGALTLDIKHSERYASKVILSSWISGEYENYDIRGAYSLMALDRNEGTENRPDTTLNAGVGSWLSHARNSYRSNVTALSYKGSASSGRSGLEWGVTARYRNYDSYRNEWLRVDSAGFTLGGTGDGLELTTSTDLAVSTGSLTAEGWIISRTGFLIAGRKSDLNAGIRTSYDTYGSELLVSPRVALRTAISQRFSLYLAAGAYHQPPGGRELLIGNDSEVPRLMAQRSWHLTAGARYDFIAWERPFRFTAEAWGKKFSRQLPYLIDNVRLVYYGGNIARGYSAGVDLRVNGEFVPGVESWFSLSLMKSEMMIPSLTTGWYPAPFDQRVHFSIFFQDYLPDHPDFRAHINIAFGTGLPTSPPGMEQWDVWFRMPPYRRIDIGFSKVLIGSPVKTKVPFMKELVAGFEIFNLADMRNTISYTWIRTVRNSQGESREYAVPNYLTRRSLNLKLTAQF